MGLCYHRYMTPYNKAIVGGVLAAVAATASAASQMDFSQGPTSAEWLHLIEIFLGSMIGTGTSVYLVPNRKVV